MITRGSSVQDKYSLEGKIEILKRTISCCDHEQARSEREALMRPIYEKALNGDADAVSRIEKIFDGIDIGRNKKCVADDPGSCYCCSNGFAKTLGQETSVKRAITPIEKDFCFH